MEDLTLEFFSFRLYWVVRLVFLARSVDAGIELLQCCHLACSSKCCHCESGQCFPTPNSSADWTLNSPEFGVSSGLGLFPLTFDWAQIAYIGSPLITPWWAAANVVGGLVVVMWIAAPVMCMMISSVCICVKWLMSSRLFKCVLFCLYAYTIIVGV